MVAESVPVANTIRHGRTFRRALNWAWTVLGPFAGLVMVTLFFYWLTRGGQFLSVFNWQTIAVQTVILGITALGMTIIMIAGGIDLSVGSVAGLCSAILGVLIVNHGWPWWAAIAVILACRMLHHAIHREVTRS